MADLKRLQVRRNKLQSEISSIREEKYSLTREETLKMQELSKVNKQLDKKKKGALIISEHAMLRYMERVKHLDIDELKMLIAPENTRKLIERFGQGKFPAGTHNLVVKNNTVLTVLTDGDK